MQLRMKYNACVGITRLWMCGVFRLRMPVRIKATNKVLMKMSSHRICNKLGSSSSTVEWVCCASASIRSGKGNDPNRGCDDQHAWLQTILTFDVLKWFLS